jgi:dTDP-4-dehydrorhamnose reductase
VYHLTAAGSTSWAGFAQAIFYHSLLEKKPLVKPIPAVSFPTPAARPANSRMSNEKLFATFGVKAPEWDDALRLCIGTMKD